LKNIAFPKMAIFVLRSKDGRHLLRSVCYKAVFSVTGPVDSNDSQSPKLSNSECLHTVYLCILRATCHENRVTGEIRG
jgi:hypothetical protein